MDAEFNMMNKNVDKCTLTRAEKVEAVTPDQYDSQKHHQSIDVVLRIWRTNQI